MGDEATIGGGEPVTGTLELDERDLRAAIVDLSGLLRARFAVMFILVFCYGGPAIANRELGQLAQPVIFSAVLIVILFGLPYYRARNLLRAIAKGGDRHASYRFDDEGLTMRTAGSTMTTAYRSLVDFRETKTAFLISTSPGVSNIVPKRAFSPEGLERVSALLAANVKVKRARTGNRLVILWFALIFLFIVVWQFLSGSGGSPQPRGATPKSETTGEPR